MMREGREAGKNINPLQNQFCGLEQTGLNTIE